MVISDDYKGFSYLCIKFEYENIDKVLCQN